MLPYALMGALALGILWVNTLLVCAATGVRIRELTRRLRSYVELGPGAQGIGILRATLESAEQPDGAVAAHSLSQIGRYATADENQILFHDAAYESSCGGGTARANGATLKVESPLHAEVWPSVTRAARAAVCSSLAEFDQAMVEARRVQGFRRLVRSEFRVGDEVWIFGELRTENGNWTVGEPAGGALLLAEMEPRTWCRQRILHLRLGQAAMLVGASVCTTLALIPPAFGTVSTVGGALGLLFFVLVQPFGKTLEEHSRLPHERIVRGEWRAPE